MTEDSLKILHRYKDFSKLVSVDDGGWRNINSVNLYMLFIEIIRYRYRFNLVHIAFCLKALGLGLFREPGNDGLGAQGHGDVEGKYQILYW